MPRGRFDIVNEQVVISALLGDSVSRRRILGALTESDFQGKRHKIIFAAVKECERRSLLPTKNNVAVHAEEDFGGMKYLEKLEDLELTENLDYHIGRLKQDAARVQVHKHWESDAKNIILDRSVDYTECIKVSAKMTHMLQEAIARRSEYGISERWTEDFDKRCGGEIPFVTTGYKSLDSVLTYGFFKTGLTVIAGRPRAGKSILITDMTRRMLKGKTKPRIGVAPLEGGPMRFMDMLVSSASGVEAEDFVKHPENLSPKAKKRIKKIAKKIAGTDDRLVVLENPFLSLAATGKWSNDSAMAKIEEILAEGGFDIVIFDLWERSLTNLDPQRIASALVRMQTLMEKYFVHGVIVQQLRRTAEDRTKDKGRRPTLPDLKNSGAYEEVADLVLLVHREKVFKPFMGKDIIEVGIAKQKRGEDGLVMLAEFVPEVCRLEDDRIAEIDTRTTMKPSMSGDAI